MFEKSDYSMDPSFTNAERIGPMEIMGNAAAERLLGTNNVKPISHSNVWLNPSAFGFDLAVNAVPAGGKRKKELLPKNAPPWLPHNPPGS
jgi:hypothetical protein